jgi:hypothetical protein
MAAKLIKSERKAKYLGKYLAIKQKSRTFAPAFRVIAGRK